MLRLLGFAPAGVVVICWICMDEDEDDDDDDDDW